LSQKGREYVIEYLKKDEKKSGITDPEKESAVRVFRPTNPTLKIESAVDGNMVTAGISAATIDEDCRGYL